MRTWKTLAAALVVAVVAGCGGGGGGGSEGTPPPVAVNAAPVANAGSAQSVVAGSVVTLDGSRSTDADRDSLTFAWTLTSKPSGSSASLSGSTSASPTFTADVAGTYTASLVVSDGKATSSASTVSVVASVANAAPVASAGTAQNVVAGTSVTLDGSASSDANGDVLTFSWTLTSRPAGSTASLVGITTAKPTFTADLAGSYVASLVVNDGKVNSSPASVTITATVANAAPVARAGSAQSVATGSSVLLDGSGSSDANGDSLTYSWSWVARPTGSSAAFSSPTAAKPTFTADVSGTYVASLIVNDGKVSSDPSNVAVDASTAAFGFAAGGNVKTYSVNKATGSLSVAGSASADSAPRSVALHPNGRYLYVSDLDANSITVFSVSRTTGALTKISRVAADASTGNTIKVINIQIDPLGRVLYVATQRTNNITSAFSTAVSTLGIDSQTGALTTLSSVTVSTNNWSITPHPNGKYLYVPSYNNANVAVYELDPSTGILASRGSVVTGDGPVHVVLDAAGKFAYVVLNNANKVASYSVDATTGALTFIESQFTGTVSAAGGQPMWLALHPSGKFLYTANYANGNITTFRPDPLTGRLGVAVTTTASAGNFPGTTFLSIDSTGQRLYAVAGFAPTTIAYSIDQTDGALTEVGRIDAGGQLVLTPIVP